MSAYHFSVSLHERFSTAVIKIRRALEDNGFGIIGEIDMGSLQSEKLGARGRPHVILRARAASEEEALLAVLPCHVVVRGTDDDEGVVVDLMDPAITFDLIGGNRTLDLTDDVRSRYEMVRQAVATAPALV